MSARGGGPHGGGPHGGGSRGGGSRGGGSHEDTARVRASARWVGLWMGLASGLVIAVGIAALIGAILLNARPELGERYEDDDHDLGHDLDRVVVDVDKILPWLIIYGVIAVALLAVIAWATARRAVQPLANALTLQRHFVADASHELRTPLTALVSRVQILERRHQRGEPIEPVIAELRRDADAMGELLADLLLEAQASAGAGPGAGAVAGSTSGSGSGAAAAADLAAVLHETLQRLAPLAAERGITLSAPEFGAGDSPLVVAVPSVALARACLAVVDNALVHSPGGGSVVLSAVPSGVFAELRVRDSGSGISEADRDRVFERFARGPETGGRRGFGLGLSLAREIVTSAGGTIAIESTSAAGTTFLLRLPLVAG